METLEERIEALGRVLRPQWRLFVRELMLDMNGTKAAIRAGYAERTAASTASRLLKNPEVRAYRDALLEQRFEEIGITQHNIAAEVWGVFQRCMEKEPVLTWNSETKDWEESGVWKFDAKGALRALELLNRMLPGISGEEDEGMSYEDLLGSE